MTAPLNPAPVMQMRAMRALLIIKLGVMLALHDCRLVKAARL
jgi:hypothetical protein